MGLLGWSSRHHLLNLTWLGVEEKVASYPGPKEGLVHTVCGHLLFHGTERTDSGSYCTELIKFCHLGCDYRMQDFFLTPCHKDLVNTLKEKATS